MFRWERGEGCGRAVMERASERSQESQVGLIRTMFEKACAAASALWGQLAPFPNEHSELSWELLVRLFRIGLGGTDELSGRRWPSNLMHAISTPDRVGQNAPQRSA
eukprot:7442999-Pyramimonas_sp.AAC.1